MPSGFRKFTALVGAAALAFTLGSTAPASAQVDGIDASSLGEGGVGSIVEGIGSVPLGSTAELLGSVGSSGFPPIGSGSVESVPEPSPVDDSITESEFLRVDRRSGDYEYWIVTSAAMQREITVEVVPSRGEGAAPVLYMLDGIGAPVRSTGWNHQGDIAERLAGENVHVVNPAGAPASYYSDWIADDPVLGRYKWETFLTEELPGIVAGRLETTGKSAVGGISMGGQAAMHLAANHPELYQGVMSFSGNYSTMDQLGYQTIRISVESRGGDMDNMWGPHGSERWRYHDTVSHPEKLRDTAVYFSAGSGAIGPDDVEEYGERVERMVLGTILERGSLEGSRKFERALDRAGVEHRADYSATGMHNWPNFIKNFDAGWNHIKPALQN